MKLPFWSSDLFESTEGFALVTNVVRRTCYELNLKVVECGDRIWKLEIKITVALLPMIMNYVSVVSYIACLKETIGQHRVRLDQRKNLIQSG